MNKEQRVEISPVFGVESNRDKSYKRTVKTNPSLTGELFDRPFSLTLGFDGLNISRGSRGRRRYRRRYLPRLIISDDSYNF